VHPGWGTRNALVGLGPHAYLEIVGPDPEQDVAERAFGVAELVRPTLVAWAVRPGPGEAFDDLVAAAGDRLGPVRAMSRRRADGRELHWRLTLPVPGPMPFLIDWGSAVPTHPAGVASDAGFHPPQVHPAAALRPVAQLESLRLSHLEPDTLAAGLRALGLAEVPCSGAPGLAAVLRTATGRLVEFV
jgi:hypothetical protein